MPKLKGKVAQAKTLPLRCVRCVATASAIADLQVRIANQERAVDRQERAITALCQTLHALAMERNARHNRAAAALAKVSAAAPARAK